MGGFDHMVVHVKGRPSLPTRKAPYIRRDGQMMTDSGLIIDFPERVEGHRVDGHLTLAQRAESLALQRLMEEHLYWVMVYGRWLDLDAWTETDTCIRQLTGMPGPVAVVGVPVLRRHMRSALHGQGIGHHPPETIWQLGIADVAALGH